jgi:hypothetical protein
VEEIDIWRTAKILLDAHGDGAGAQAEWRADKALKDGNLDALRVWKRVLQAVQVLQ